MRSKFVLRAGNLAELGVGVVYCSPRTPPMSSEPRQPIAPVDVAPGSVPSVGYNMASSGTVP